MSDPCIAINGAGIAYREFSCDYPQLEPFYFEYVSSQLFVVVVSESVFIVVVVVVVDRRSVAIYMGRGMWDVLSFRSFGLSNVFLQHVHFSPSISIFPLVNRIHLSLSSSLLSSTESKQSKTTTIDYDKTTTTIITTTTECTNIY